jgi:hypothetical protein
MDGAYLQADEIVILTCARDHDLLPRVIRSVRDVWPVPLTIYAHVWRRGDPLAEQMMCALSSIVSNAAIVIMGDYHFDRVDAELLSTARALAQGGEWQTVRINPCTGPTATGPDLPPGFGVIQPTDPYSVSLQSAYWAKLSNRHPYNWLAPGWSPWDVELRGSAMVAKMAGPPPMCGTFARAVEYHELSIKGRRL